ncbi:MAG: YjjG family noncanonical pyrimidine nucleotidase [Lachnospiraceae bacterium]|nr:YjjG family noncanonical pyrimidine nucleotidase [Lachnospiraceae bacterium]
MKKFTTILWDVDGTLLDFLYSQKYAITKCFRTAGRDITEEQIKRYSQINDDYWRRLELGEITKDQLLMGRFATLFEEYKIKDIDLAVFAKEYQEALGSVFSFIDDSLTICKALQEKVRQYVITNGVTATQMNKLKLSGLAEAMDGIFISEQIGTPKPAKEFFDYCLKHIEEKDKSKLLIVGDSLSSDIKGGVLSGIPTCWYRPEGAINDTPYHPDYEISDLHMLYDILEVF